MKKYLLDKWLVYTGKFSLLSIKVTISANYPQIFRNRSKRWLFGTIAVQIMAAILYNAVDHFV